MNEIILYPFPNNSQYNSPYLALYDCGDYLSQYYIRLSIKINIKILLNLVHKIIRNYLYISL